MINTAGFPVTTLSFGLARTNFWGDKCFPTPKFRLPSNKRTFGLARRTFRATNVFETKPLPYKSNVGISLYSNKLTFGLAGTNFWGNKCFLVPWLRSATLICECVNTQNNLATKPSLRSASTKFWGSLYIQHQNIALWLYYACFIYAPDHLVIEPTFGLTKTNNQGMKRYVRFPEPKLGSNNLRGFS